MKINFNLSRRLVNNDYSIYAIVSRIAKGKRFFIATGESINKKFWDCDKQRVKHSHLQSYSINQRLNTIETIIKEKVRDLLNQNKTYEEIKKEVRSLFEVKVSDNNFFDVFNEFIEVKQNNVSKANIEKLKLIKNLLLEFENNTGYKITFDSINLNFFDKFQNYCLSERSNFKNVKGNNLTCYNNNTFKRTIGFLRTFLIWSNERGYSNNTEYKKFKAKGYENEIITLTEQELFQFYYYKFDNVRLEKVKDLFCFGCFTGQRFSDIQGLNFNDVQFNVWNLRTQKTKDILQIPLTSYALEIIDKYKGLGFNSLPKLSNQKFNEYLKEALKEAGINTLVKIVRFVGSQRIEQVKPKFEVIGTHTARRTFISLSLEKGISTEILMKITGHKDYKTLKQYINISTKAKETELKKIWENNSNLTLVKNN